MKKDFLGAISDYNKSILFKLNDDHVFYLRGYAKGKLKTMKHL